MLEPAVLHKEELLKLFAKEIYTSDWFYYVGYPNSFDIPKIEISFGYYQWAIMDKDKVIGYLAYNVDNCTDCAHKFGLYSFDRGNPIVGFDLFRKMEELVKRYHRVEWIKTTSLRWKRAAIATAVAIIPRRMFDI